jgi:S1-C subfamily serine protease
MKVHMLTLFLLLCGLLSAGLSLPNYASENWERLDKKLKSQVFQLNVGLKLKLIDGKSVQLADLSPKYHYPIFGITQEDHGFRVVGSGTCFPIMVKTKVVSPNDTYFVTNRHVVQSGLTLIKEAERFFAAIRLYAEQTAAGKSVQTRHAELIEILNLSIKKKLSTTELKNYQSTADAIWDTYEAYLSVKADPARALFARYKAMDELQSTVGYFIHEPGSVSKPAKEAKVYKIGKPESDPDLAILSVPGKFPGIELDSIAPREGQEIQVVGYPSASEQIDIDAAKYYTPTFSSGRISRVDNRMLQVDAPITTGNSGGPVLSLRGKALGVVAVRAISTLGSELPNFGAAFSAQTLRAFAPELF